MKIFLDANILVSVLNKEYPKFTFSSRVLSLADHNKFSLFTSPICLAIAFYFSEKKSGRLMAKKKIEILVSKLNISTTNKEVVTKAITDKKITDFEDGLKYYSALSSGCNCIITEDKKDFHYSKIEILTAEEFLGKHVVSF